MVYDSAALRPPVVQELVELVRYRDLLWLVTLSQIKTRYRRSVLGILWTLIGPLLTMTVLTIAFSQLFRFRVPGYPVYVLSGLLLWNFFTQSTITGMGTLARGNDVLKRVYVPTAVFPTAAVGTGIVNLGLSMAPLLLIKIVTGHPFSWALLFLPVAVLVTAMFSLGVALLLSTIAAFFNDVVDMYDVAVRAWYFLTPIMYPESIIPDRWRWVVDLNPMYHNMLLWRQPIYDGVLPSAHTILIAVAWGLGMLAVGWSLFAQKAHEFAYHS